MSQEMLHCPYNYSHFILKSRMASHLQKCREQFPLEKYTTCPFNATHDVPVPELKYHTDTCPDRKNMENYLYVMGDKQKKKEEPKVVEIKASSSEENWDEERVPGSYLETKSKILPETKVFKPVPSGKSKSEKKAFSQSQVKKFSEEHTKKPIVETIKTDPLRFAFPDEEPVPLAGGFGVQSLSGEEEKFTEVVRKSKRKGISRGLNIK